VNMLYYKTTSVHNNIWGDNCHSIYAV